VFTAEANMTKYNYLTDEEFVAHLTTRDDLTEIEHELLDRLIRALDAMDDVVPELEVEGVPV